MTKEEFDALQTKALEGKVPTGRYKGLTRKEALIQRSLDFATGAASDMKAQDANAIEMWLMRIGGQGHVAEEKKQQAREAAARAAVFISSNVDGRQLVKRPDGLWEEASLEKLRVLNPDQKLLKETNEKAPE